MEALKPHVATDPALVVAMTTWLAQHLHDYTTLKEAFAACAAANPPLTLGRVASLWNSRVRKVIINDADDFLSHMTPWQIWLRDHITEYQTKELAFSACAAEFPDVQRKTAMHWWYGDYAPRFSDLVQSPTQAIAMEPLATQLLRITEKIEVLETQYAAAREEITTLRRTVTTQAQALAAAHESAQDNIALVTWARDIQERWQAFNETLVTMKNHEVIEVRHARD